MKERVEEIGNRGKKSWELLIGDYPCISCL